jgi:hypothetical protein
MKEMTPAGQVALPTFSLERSHPRNLNAAVEKKDAAVVAVMKARIHKMLTKERLEGINFVSVWIGRRMAPLGLRPMLMCHYTGAKDDSQLTEAEWREGESALDVQRVTLLTLDHIKETKMPYCSKNPPPLVSSLINESPSVLFVRFTL